MIILSQKEKNAVKSQEVIVQNSQKLLAPQTIAGTVVT